MLTILPDALVTTLFFLDRYAFQGENTAQLVFLLCGLSLVPKGKTKLIVAALGATAYILFETKLFKGHMPFILLLTNLYQIVYGCTSRRVEDFKG